MPPTFGIRKKLGWGARSSRDETIRRSESPSPSFASADTLAPPDSSVDVGGSSKATALLRPPRTDPLGLHVVHDPSSSPKAHIVFVHGLGGTSRMTWTKNKDLELFWPGTFLPLENDIAQTRILTFGYNADVRKNGGHSSVIDFAKDLLFELKYAKDSDGTDLKIAEVPLIFVAHSMGGLIVKQAYLQGQYNPDYADIAKAVTAILFLSTPHRGSNLAETLNRIIQVSFVSTPKAYIAELARNSFTVQNINEQFRHLAPKLHIVSFYETQSTPVGPTKSRIMVVEKDSSVLGYPGEISKGLDANHFTVCKYESRQDPSYVAVRNYLKSNVAKLLAVYSSRASASSTSTNLDSRELERLFHISEPPDSDYICFRDRWVYGTCEWITRDDRFSRWLDDPSDSPQLLWIHGVPGSGKSILSSFVVNHLAERGKPCQYVFVRSGDHAKRSLGSMLSSIAFQVAQALPSFRQALSKMARTMKLRVTDPRIIWQRFFRAVLLRQDFSMPIYWVIDGLGESDDPRTGAKMLSEVLGVHLPIRILITSRQTPEIVGELKKISTDPGFAEISLEDNLEDYRTFIQEELDWSEMPDFNDRITQKLLDMAEGSFLWLALTVERLKKCHTEQAVNEALREIPLGMEDLYDQMATSLDEQPPADKVLAASIMAWVACAGRSLSVLELEEALEPEGHRVLHLQRSVGAVCAGFVAVDNDGSLNLVHQTAREYLLRSGGALFTVDKHVANQAIFIRCIACLATYGLRGKAMRGQAPILTSYAARYWAVHLSYCNLASEDVVDALAKFLRSQAVLTWIRVLADGGQLGVMISASSRLSVFAKRLNTLEAIKMPADRRQHDVDLIEGWATDLSKVAGRFGNQLLHQPDSIYALIPPFCPTNSMIHKQFARKDGKSIAVSVPLAMNDWDDSSARLSLATDYEATAVLTGSWLVVVAKVDGGKGKIIIYNAGTHERFRELDHNERIRKVQLSPLGNILVSSGLHTTKVWDVLTGGLVTEAKNPPSRPRPQAIMFTQDEEGLLVASDERRIWSMSLLSRPKTAMKEKRYIKEAGGPDGPVNCPTCTALSPDGQRAAFGYRAGPLTIWDLETPELLVSCRELTRITQIVWHPDPQCEEIFGLMLHLAGRVFKWNLDHDSEPLSEWIEASCMAINHNGTLLAVGDHHGNIKLLSTVNLSLVYYMATQDPVVDLVFSTDGHQLYDLRTSHTNVWEPTVLVKFAEPTSQPSDADGDTSSAFTKITTGQPQVEYFRVDPITALKTQNRDSMYCLGTRSGVTSLYSTSGTILSELGRTQNSSIQQISWDDDGSRICYSDISRTIYVETIRQTAGSNKLSVERYLKMSIREMRDNIKQILFHPRGALVLVSSQSACVVVSLSEQAVVASWTDEANHGKWIRHPFDPDLLLFVGPWSVKTFLWSSLDMEATQSLEQDPRLYSAHGNPQDLHVDTDINSWQLTVSPGSRLAVQKLLPSPSKQHLLVQVSNHDGQTFVRLLRISYSKEQLLIKDVDLPSELVRRLDRPLRFLNTSRTADTLAFLDCSSWLCTWDVLAGVASDVTAHYCLPGDWVSPECVGLVELLADGTLLCPRNGVVATVHYASVVE